MISTVRVGRDGGRWCTMQEKSPRMKWAQCSAFHMPDFAAWRRSPPPAFSGNRARLVEDTYGATPAARAASSRGGANDAFLFAGFPVLLACRASRRAASRASCSRGSQRLRRRYASIRRLPLISPAAVVDVVHFAPDASILTSARGPLLSRPRDGFLGAQGRRRRRGAVLALGPAKTRFRVQGDSLRGARHAGDPVTQANTSTMTLQESVQVNRGGPGTAL